MVNKNDNIAPDVLELLKDVVIGDINDYSINIDDYDGKGEGFIGDVTFLTLTNNKTNEKEGVVLKEQKTVKGEPLNITIAAFENEINFYRDIWCTLEQFYKDSTKKTINFIPKCVATSRSKMRKVVLENLKLQGFAPHDKTKPFDTVHFTAVLRTYGVFHALSMALKQQNSEEFRRLEGLLYYIDERDFDKDKSFGGKVLKTVCRDFQKMFDANDEILIEYLKLYERIGPKIVDRCFCEGQLNGILLHGDSWSNNFMFKYDDAGKLIDLRMIDFQFGFSGSPVFDLSYLIYSGGSLETFENLDEYLKIYHSSLEKTLSEFGLEAEKIYSFTNLKDEWRKYCKHGFAMGVVLWSMKLADKDAIQITESEEMELFKIADGFQDEYEKRIKDLIIHMHKNYFF